MSDRRGEKIGWTYGWLGGFVWVGALAAVFLFQTRWMEGFAGFILLCAAISAIVLLAPWRHPSVPYGKLLIVPYGLFFASIVWAVWAFGGLKAAGMDWWSMLWLIPLLIPFGTLSKRRWNDSKAELENNKELC